MMEGMRRISFGADRGYDLLEILLMGMKKSQLV